MSEFILVAPEEWIALSDSEMETLLGLVSLEQLTVYVNSTIVDVDTLLGDMGILPQGWTLTAARIFTDGGVSRLWYQKAQVPE